MGPLSNMHIFLLDSNSLAFQFLLGLCPLVLWTTLSLILSLGFALTLPFWIWGLLTNSEPGVREHLAMKQSEVTIPAPGPADISSPEQFYGCPKFKTGKAMLSYPSVSGTESFNRLQQNKKKIEISSGWSLIFTTPILYTHLGQQSHQASW